MKSEKQSSKSAKILYRPWGLVASLLGGLIAGQIFQQVWKRLDPDSSEDPPKPLQSEYRLRKILIAALLLGITKATAVLPGVLLSHAFLPCRFPAAVYATRLLNSRASGGAAGAST